MEHLVYVPYLILNDYTWVIGCFWEYDGYNGNQKWYKTKEIMWAQVTIVIIADLYS